MKFGESSGSPSAVQSSAEKQDTVYSDPSVRPMGRGGFDAVQVVPVSVCTSGSGGAFESASVSEPAAVHDPGAVHETDVSGPLRCPGAAATGRVTQSEPV